MSEFGAIDPSVAECVGALTINDVLLHTRGCNVLTPIPLWYPPHLRGENVIISGVPGQRGYPFEVEQTDYIFPMLVSGRYLIETDTADPDGYFACLRRNFRYLRQHVYGPCDGSTATWYSTVEYPWGEIEEADVQVLDLGETYQAVELVKTNITIRVPEGEYALVTS